MKKLNLTAMTLALVMVSPVAFADHHGDDEKMGKKHERMAEMMDKHFAEKDLDGNGSISKEEFLKASEARFDEMDADGNGELTKEETKAHFQEKREKWKAMKEKMKEKKASE